jgi:hypothetical protein
MEYMDDESSIIEELIEWENPSKEYKDALLSCIVGIFLY